MSKRPPRRGSHRDRAATALPGTSLFRPKWNWASKGYETRRKGGAVETTKMMVVLMTLWKKPGTGL